MTRRMYGIEFIPLASDCPPAGSFDCALALGCFDGFHKAHRRITDAAATLAERLSGQGTEVRGGVFCFREPPAAYFGKSVPVLTDIAEKCRLFAGAGLDFAFIADFAAVRELTPERFAKEVLSDFCRCRAVACGFNFTFGRNAKGDPATLAAVFGADRVAVLPPVTEGGEAVSSSRIRGLIASGEIEAANDLLGHPFSVCGEVCRGRGDGHRLGFPTFNQLPASCAAVPAPGVYVSAVSLSPDAEPDCAVTDVGKAPTMDKSGVFRYETHLLSDPGDTLYGTSPRVFLLKRLRGEVKFSSPDELVSQIERDTAAARKYFTEHKINFDDNGKIRCK